MARLIVGDMPRDQQELLAARYVLQELPTYAKPEYPQRPAAITFDDGELLDAYDALQRGEKLGVDKRRQLSYLGSWRYAVWSAEARAQQKLEMLAWSYWILADADRDADADALRVYALEQYGARCEDFPAPVIEQRKWSWRACADLTLLPLYLRTMEKPRGGVPFHRQAAAADDTRQAEAEREDQGELPW